jgi:hypothetical protein
VSYKLSTLCLLFACVVGTSASLFGQDAETVHGIPGYLNPKTGAFHPMPQASTIDPTDAAAAVALTTFSGKIVVNFTITVSSTIASTNKIACSVSAFLSDIGSANTITEQAANAVTRGTATTVACSVSIPYSWKLASATTDTIGLSWSIQSPVEVATPAAAFPTRLSSQTLGSIKVPTTGTTTTMAVTATI